MLNGFWTVTFHTNASAGAGVVMLQEGKAIGGDTSFMYIGALKENGGGKLLGELHIKRHSSILPGLIPGLDDYFLILAGEAQGDQFSLSGTLKGQAHAQVTINGKRAKAA